MKQIFALVSVLLSLGFAANAQAATYYCYEQHNKGAAVQLTVDAERADFNGHVFTRDAQKKVSRYSKYTSQGLTLLVPTPIAHNKENQGVVRFYSEYGRVLFTCHR